MKGVAMLYRWSVAPEEHRRFIAQWRTTAQEMRRSGARGCSLLHADNGDFVALVRWPSEYARLRGFEAQDFPAWSSGIRGFAETRLSIEDDVANDPGLVLGLAL